jgi:hypothetical protein
MPSSLSITSTPGQLEVTPALPEDIDEIGRLIATVFGADLPPRFVDRKFLEWKFFTPRPDWEGPRSFVVRDAGHIVAHACIWPTAFGSHIIDWLSDGSTPGAGVLVYRHLMQLSGTAIVMGGSAQARKLLPKLGFKAYGTLEIYARVIRPWKQFVTRPRGALWREAARLGRNTFWSLARLPKPDRGWSAEPAVATGRIAYMLACPAGDCRFYRISHNGTPCGYFSLNQVNGQCRIIDIDVDSDDRADLRAAYRLAASAAANLPETCEITAVSSLPWVAEILRQDGFRLSGDKPVVLYDPQSRLAGAPPPNLQMVDSDAFFLYITIYPFVT